MMIARIPRPIFTQNSDEISRRRSAELLLTAAAKNCMAGDNRGSACGFEPESMRNGTYN